MTDPRKQSVAVVTGGASGIGLALAHAFGGQGDNVLIADLDAAAMTGAVTQLEAAGIEAHSYVVDLRDHDAVVSLAARAQELGTIRTVCMNAGVSTTGLNIWETPPQAFDFVLDVNLRGLYHSVAAFVPVLLKQERPANVVITASMAGLVASPNSASYSASKAGAVALTKALRVELANIAPHIKVALLLPGMVQTNLQRTSAAQQPAAGAMSSELVEASHNALNSFGVSPQAAASWVLAALEQNRFWVLPPDDDPFLESLIGELAELRSSIPSATRGNHD
jgi:NAD(P)-dependent dehydrogenase (short-subunit alcohol dehydrogenase family)